MAGGSDIGSGVGVGMGCRLVECGVEVGLGKDRRPASVRKECRLERRLASQTALSRPRAPFSAERKPNKLHSQAMSERPSLHPMSQ